MGKLVRGSLERSVSVLVFFSKNQIEFLEPVLERKLQLETFENWTQNRVPSSIFILGTKTKFVVSLGDNFLGLWPRVVGVTRLVCVFLFLFAMEFSICSHQKKKRKQTNKQTNPNPKLNPNLSTKHGLNGGLTRG